MKEINTVWVVTGGMQDVDLTLFDLFLTRQEARDEKKALEEDFPEKSIGYFKVNKFLKVD